ncbi:MAG: nitrogen regulation protein NR(II), partial [Gammaproteobacteria bacterium]|nr:nitrogen regulation protein NR(II) [Gammaproteobacteria bacterium]
AENLLGISLRQMEGHSASELFPGSEEFLSAIEESLQSEFNYTRRELELNIPSIMSTVMTDCAFIPVKEEDLILIELHDVDRMQKIAKEENMQAQQSVLKTLVRGFAHEVKNPLGGIRGAAQLLESELPSDELKEYTEVIINETSRLQNLVDQMLGPNRPLNKTGINIHRVLERVRQLVLAEAGDELQIKRDYDPSLPEIKGDPDQLIQAVLNITQNARQALNGKGVIKFRTRSKRRVVIDGKMHRLVLKVEIIDNGPGISEEMQGKIFYPMVTGRAEGTGLGLSITQTLINQHGGIVECESKPGETCFTILLPINTEEF